MANANSASIVFVGNCQMATLRLLYKSVTEGYLHNEAVDFIPSYVSPNENTLNILGNASIIVQQITDFAPKIGPLPSGASVVFVPHITSAFLWPLMGQAHPSNSAIPFGDASGPYPAEFGDALLNRMIEDRIDPETAVNRYLQTDVAKLRRVERLRAAVLEKQHQRDHICGFQFAEHIESRFRTEKLFRSANHPERDLTMKFASDVFQKMGLDSNIIEKLNSHKISELFPKTESPIHPSIAECFGLSYINAHSHYRYFSEGKYTISEYAMRYLRYEYCPELSLALHLLRERRDKEAMDLLESVIVKVPRSAEARSVLADLFERHGRLAEAASLAQDAQSLEPDVNHYRLRLDHIISKLCGQGGAKTYPAFGVGQG